MPECKAMIKLDENGPLSNFPERKGHRLGVNACTDAGLRMAEATACSSVLQGSGARQPGHA
jgi:hypothetical protein